MAKLENPRARLAALRPSDYLLIAGWLVASVTLFVEAYKVRFLLSNVDGISYISIAENYFAGRFDEAVNAYWSPLISWSMLPFMAAGADSLFAMALASATWASLGIAAGTFLVWRWTRHSVVATATIGVVLSVFAVGNLTSTTPDLILASWTAIFALVLVEANERLGAGSRRGQILFGAVLGVTCAVGYFAKAFALPLFAVVGIAWIVVRLLATRAAHPRGQRRAPIVRQLWMPLAALAALVLIAGPFVTALSVKYGGPTLGSSFQVNTMGPFEPTTDAASGVSLELAPPPSPHSISFSDDRTAVLTDGSAVDAGSTSGSAIERAVQYAALRLRVLPFYLAKIEAVAPFAPVIGALFVILLGLRVIDPRRHRAAVLVGTVLVVYFLGYWASTSSLEREGNYRYHWPELVLSTIVAALLWPAVLARARAAGRWWSSATAGALIAVLIVSTLAQHAVNYFPFTTERPSASVSYVVKDPVPEPASRIFAEKLVADGVVAPWSKIVGSTGWKDRTLIYAFYMRAQLFGRRVPHDIHDPRFIENMQKLGIDYYFLYEPTGSPTLDVSAWGRVKATYEMPYACGPSGSSTSTTCRLSIVALTR